MLFSSNKTNKNPSSSSSSSFLGELFQSFSDAKEYASSMKRKLAASKGTEDEAYYSKKLATAEQNAKSLEEQITALKSDAEAVTAATSPAAESTATPAPAVAPVPAAESTATPAPAAAPVPAAEDVTAAAPAVPDIAAAVCANVVSGVAVQTEAASPTATVSAPADAVADKAVESAAPSMSHAPAAASGFEATEEAAAVDVAHNYQSISAAEAIQGFTDASIAHADVAVEHLDNHEFDEDGIYDLADNFADSDVRGAALSNAGIDEAYDAKYSNDLSDAVEALAALSLAEMEDEVANSASYECVSTDEIADEPSDYADYEDSAAPPNEILDAKEAKTADAVAAESLADDATESVEVDMDSIDDLLSDDEVIDFDESLDGSDADILTDSAADDNADDADDVAEDDDAQGVGCVLSTAAAEDKSEAVNEAWESSNASADEGAVEADAETGSAATAHAKEAFADVGATAVANVDEGAANSKDNAVKSAVTDSAVQASTAEATVAVADGDADSDTESVHAAKAVNTAVDSKAATDAVAVESKTKSNADVAIVADTAESEVGSNKDTVAGAAVAVAKEVATTKKLAAAAKALEKAKAEANEHAIAAGDAGAAGDAKSKGADGDEDGKDAGGDEVNARAKGTSSKRRLKDLAQMRIEGDSVYLKDGDSHFAQMRMKLRKALATAIEEAGEHLPEWFELSCTMMLLFGRLGIQEVEYTTRVMLAAAWRRRQTSSGVRSCLMRKEFMDDLSPVVDVHRLAIKASDSVMNKERRELHARCYDYIHSDDFIGKGAFEDMCHEPSTEFIHLSEREIVLRCRLQWYQGLVDFAKVNANHKAVVAQYDKRLIASKIEIRPTMAAYAYTESYDSAAGSLTSANSIAANTGAADAAGDGSTAVGATSAAAAGAGSAAAGATGAAADGVAASRAVIDAATAKYEKAVRKYILAGKLHFVPSAQEVFEVCSGVAPVLADAEKQYIAEVLCNRYEAQVLDKRNARMRAGDMSSLRNAIKRFKLLTEERDAVANTLQCFLGRMSTIIKSMKACKARNLTASGLCDSALGLAVDKGELLDNSLVSVFDLEREALNHDAQDLLDAAAEQLDGYGTSLGAYDDTTSAVHGADAAHSEHTAIDGLASPSEAESLESGITAAAEKKAMASVAAFADMEDSAHSTTDDYSSTGEARASDYLDSHDETMGGRAASAAQDGDTSSYDGNILSQDHDTTAGLSGDDGSGSGLLGEASLSSNTARTAEEAVGSAQDSELSADSLQEHREDRAMESVGSELSSTKDATAEALDAASDVAESAGVASAFAASVAVADVLADSEEHGDAYSANTETNEVATATHSHEVAMEQASAIACVSQASAGAVGRTQAQAKAQSQSQAQAQAQSQSQAKDAGLAQLATGTAVAEDSEPDTDSVSNESGQIGTASTSGQRTTTAAKGSNQARVLASAAKDAPEGCQISLEAGDQMIMGPSYKRRQNAKAMKSSKQGEATASGSMGAAATTAAATAAAATAAAATAAAATTAAGDKAAVEALGGVSLGQSLTAGANGTFQYGDIEDVFTSDRGCDMDTSVILHKQDKSTVAANDALASNGGCASASALNAAFGHAALAAAEESGLVEDDRNGLADSGTIGHTAFMANKARGTTVSSQAAEAAVAADADAGDAGAEACVAGAVACDSVATGVAKGYKSHSKAKAKAKAKNKSWKHSKAHQISGGDAHAAHRSNLSLALAQASALGGVCQTVNLSQALGMFQEPAKAGSASLPLTSEYLAKPQSTYEQSSTSERLCLTTKRP